MAKKRSTRILILCILLSRFIFIVNGQVNVNSGSDEGKITINDNNRTLSLIIDCSRKCKIAYAEVFGKPVISNQSGVFSSIMVNGRLYSSGEGIPSPEIKTEADRTVIDNIVFGEKENQVHEKWIFRPAGDYIDWTIERTYQSNMTLEDTGFPEWSFDSMDTWTGALLGTGGVAWCKFFDRINASLGNHTGKVTFWNQASSSCLSIDPTVTAGQNIAVRFSRQPDNRFTLNYIVSEDELRTKHFLSRFIIDRQDIWDAFDATGKTSITYRRRALNYDKAYYRGEFPGINGESVRSVLNTIARVGVIDEKLVGSNNWHLDMGFVCLHEHWIAQMGIAIDDSCYLENYRKSLDYFRDNAISTIGDVKDRWAYRIWDSQPGTFENGFYEAQWGNLLDANTDYVMNVSELFQINGNLDWVRTHKTQCEKVLEFLLSRDSDDNGLIEVFAKTHEEQKGSDWIDVIWASWENAFINAKFYEALNRWADVEEITGDPARSTYYRSIAVRCKYRFNQPVSKGGFWNPEKNWYVYWRDRDNTIHGDNLVTPVNFMAIAFGICDDPVRKNAILGAIEILMKKENLFMWPISFFPYKPDEGLKVNYPFPNYENGDIFLAWGEVGIRAYQDYGPAIPLKYIRNVLNQYEKDGLAYQRYDRKKQEGAGNDILANNCLPVVGLYRDIYGIQPMYNRLYLEPHITSELNGTIIKYWLRNQNYTLKLSVNDYTMCANLFSVNSSGSFGINAEEDTLLCYSGKNQLPWMLVSRNRKSELFIKIINTDAGIKESLKWVASSGKESISTEYTIYRLKPNNSYRILKNGKIYSVGKSDTNGRLNVSSSANPGIYDTYEIIQVV